MIAEIVLMAALTVLPPLDTEPPGGVPDSGIAGGEVVEILPEEGDIIVLPGDDLSSGDTSVDDNNNSVDGLGGVVDEPVPDSGNNTVVVISPDDLAAILSSADDVALLADYGVTGDSLLSGSFLTYCQGLAARVPWGSHYVAWRDSSDYSSASYFAYGDLQESGGEFTGDVRVLRYYRPNNNSDWRLEWSNDNNFSLSAANGFAYSDLGEFPALNGGETLEKALVWLVGLGIVIQLVFSVLLGRYGR